MNLSDLFLKSVPKAGPNAKATINSAQQKIAVLRAQGFSKAADVFEQDISRKIKNNDFSTLGKDFENLGEFYGENIKRERAKGAEESPPEYGSEDLAMRIQDTLSLADERVVDLPNSSLARLSSFVAKGDTKKASQQLGEISTFIDNALKTQTDETKKTVDLQDGTQVQIGEKSGIRYIGGQPVSKGAVNADVFNSMYQKESKAETEALGIPFISQSSVAPQTYKVAPVEGFVAQPEIYAQAVKEAPTSMEQKQIAMRKASEAYKAGNDEEAVILMNAAGGKGLMGVFTTEDLPTVFGERGEKSQEQRDNKNKTKSGTSYQIIQE